MKEKLLKLVQACIKDNSMYKHTYHKSNNTQIGENGNYRGITVTHTTPRTSFVSRIEYKGKEILVNRNSTYQCDLSPYVKHEKDAYELQIGFGDEPQLTIRPILKGNSASLPKVEGTVNKWLTKPKRVFDVTIVTEIYQYELRCGSFAYIVEESVVKDFFEQINNRRKEIANDTELQEIESRFTKYRIA